MPIFFIALRGADQLMMWENSVMFFETVVAAERFIKSVCDTLDDKNATTLREQAVVVNGMDDHWQASAQGSTMINLTNDHRPPSTSFWVGY